MLQLVSLRAVRLSVALTLSIGLMLPLAPAAFTQAPPPPSGPIQLVQDLNPSLYHYANPALLGQVGGDLLFVQDVDPFGRELWVSDGTPDGTRLVADLNPGLLDSNVDYLTLDQPSYRSSIAVLGAKVFFVANTVYYGAELHVYDHDAETVERLDVLPGGSGLLPYWLTVHAGKVYFVGRTDGDQDTELWVTDGTQAGTRPVADIRVGSLGSSPQWLTSVGDRLIFSADDGVHGRELWVSDGTAAGTTLLQNIAPDAESSDPTELLFHDGLLYFSANDQQTRELWVSDGTAAGTQMIRPASGFEFGVSPTALTVFQGAVYFRGLDTLDNVRLWQTDGTPGGTTPINGLFEPSGIAATDTRLFMTALDATYSAIQIWSFDGAAAAAVSAALPDFSDVQAASATPERYGVVYRDTTGATRLWVSDGTPGGTLEIGPLNPNGSALIEDVYGVGDTLYFDADDGERGRTLWKSDGTVGGTRRVETADRAGTSFPGELFALNGRMFFSADDGESGFEIWSTDLTEGNAQLIKDIYPGAKNGLRNSSFATRGIAMDTVAYFGADNGVNGSELWVTDGTAAGTTLFKELRPGAFGSAPRLFTRMGERFFFSAFGPNGRELWVSDGTADGTVEVKNIAPGSASSLPTSLTVFGNRLFFVADDGVHGSELWVSDGTAAGTLLVADIFAGSVGSTPNRLTLHDDMVYFTANDGVHGRELWRYDPAQNELILLDDLYSGPIGSSPNNLLSLGEVLLFTANLPELGAELVQYAANGEFLVGDLNPGPASSNPAWLTVAGDRLFFGADDGEHGVELWAVEAHSMPRMVADINRGPDDGWPEEITAIPGTGQVAFKADDGVHGHELWRSDGANTSMVADLEPGAGASSPVYLKVLGDRLKMVAWTSATGNEIFSVPFQALNGRTYLPLIR